jgi:hypothetical protein
MNDPFVFMQLVNLSQYPRAHSFTSKCTELKVKKKKDATFSIFGNLGICHVKQKILEIATKIPNMVLKKKKKKTNKNKINKAIIQVRIPLIIPIVQLESE